MVQASTVEPIDHQLDLARIKTTEATFWITDPRSVHLYVPRLTYPYSACFNCEIPVYRILTHTPVRGRVVG